MTEGDDAAARAWVVLGRDGSDIIAAHLDSQGAVTREDRLSAGSLAEWVLECESRWSPRWVWSDSARWYGDLLALGVRVARCHDLRLIHAILRDSTLVTDRAMLSAHPEWDHAADIVAERPSLPTLFELVAPSPSGPPDSLDSAVAEFTRQRAALASAAAPERLRLLVAAESAGALVAAELRAAGLPWDEAAHDALLTAALGDRGEPGAPPARMVQLASEIRAALGDPDLRVDSPPKVLRALHRVGVLVESTSRWDLADQQHPAIAPLLEYKKLARLHTANGWAWLAEWVHDHRFRPVYLPGGVVTGRWASSGGGALQIPRQLRAAVRADPGWTLVIADVAQLEPRVLAAMSRDIDLADAARGRDLYAGIVETGAVTTRADAKLAMLGAMYGATTGDSGRLVPRLRRTFRRAMALVDEAAREGERGGTVTTWLGRSSPPASAEWTAAQSAASAVDASSREEARARRTAGDRGRFTRNFVVQGTAAEWALAWLADLRGRLAALPEVAVAQATAYSGPVFARRPHLAFFLHDEVIIHSPIELVDDVASAVREAAASATRLLFGDFPLDFPLDLQIAEAAREK